MILISPTGVFHISQLTSRIFALSLKTGFGIFEYTPGISVSTEMTSGFQRVARVAEEARLESV